MSVGALYFGDKQIARVYKGSVLVWSMSEPLPSVYMKYFTDGIMKDVKESIAIYESTGTEFTFVLNVNLKTWNYNGYVPMMGQVYLATPYNFLSTWNDPGDCYTTTGTGNRFLAPVPSSVRVEELTAIMSDGTVEKRYIHHVPKSNGANLLICIGMEEAYATTEAYLENNCHELTDVTMMMTDDHPTQEDFVRAAYNFQNGKYRSFAQVKPFSEQRYNFPGDSYAQYTFGWELAEMTTDWTWGDAGFRAIDCASEITDEYRLVSLFRYNYDQRDLNLLEVFCPANESCSKPCYILEFFKTDGTPYNIGEEFYIGDFDVTKTKMVGYSNSNWTYNGHDVIWIDSVAYRNYRVGFDNHNCTLKPGHLYGIVYSKDGNSNGYLASSIIRNSSIGVNAKITRDLYNSLNTGMYGNTIGATSSNFDFYIGHQVLGRCQHYVYRRYNDPAGTYGTSLYPSNMCY